MCGDLEERGILDLSENLAWMLLLDGMARRALVVGRRLQIRHTKASMAPEPRQ